MPPSRVSMHHWEDAIGWLGATHVGVGRRILEQLRWWELCADPGAVEPHAGPDDWFQPYAATLPHGSRVVYLPSRAVASGSAFTIATTTLTGLTPGVSYRATYVDPRTGRAEPSVTFSTEDGRQPVRKLLDFSLSTPYFEAPTGEDWVLVIRPVGTAASLAEHPWP